MTAGKKTAFEKTGKYSHRS